MSTRKAAKKTAKKSQKSAGKTAPEPVAEETAEPVKICFERIIPDALDPERAVRSTLRTVMAANTGRTLDADEMGQIARMALINSK